ncbi:hypothetical protein [Streptomyces prasinus]
MTEPTTETGRLHDQILTLQAELAQMRDLLRSENQRANAAIDRETTAEQAALEAEEERDRLRAFPVSSPPADRAAVLHAAADELEAQLAQLFVDWPSEPRNSPGVRSWKEAVDSLRRLADEAPAAAEPSPDVDPVYDPRAWEMYRRDAGCGCTAPAPVDCKVPHGTGAWLCVCHRLAGSPPVTDPGKPLAVLGTGKHFTEPNRCVSTDGIFRCARPTGHPGGHRTGRTFWPRHAEGETQSAATPPPA